MVILGLDPGMAGGIAVLGRPQPERDVFEFLNNQYILARWDIRAYLERVHSMPKQGVASSFTFGRNYGFLRGCLVALGIPFEEVTPQRWQRALGCLTKRGATRTQHKNAMKAKAQNLFPQLKVTLATADALLICEYGRRLRAGELINGGVL